MLGSAEHLEGTAGKLPAHRTLRLLARCPDAERRRRPARPPSLLAAVASTRTTPSPDLFGPRRSPGRRGWCCRGLWMP